MSLSVGNFQEFLHKKEVTFDLERARVVLPESHESPLDLNQWPILLFLNSLGFSKVTFREPNAAVLEGWIQRVSDLEQIYIHDPESLNQDAILWDAYDESGREVIHCEQLVKQKPERLFTSNSTLPPFAAPLNMPPDFIARFVSELRQEKPLDILRRFVMILHEFLAVDCPQNIAEKLFLRALKLSLEASPLELAVDLVKEHADLWERLISRDGILENILNDYDPKPQEIPLWSQLFQELSSEKIVQICISFRGHALENRALKLLHYRCLRSPGEFFDLALRGDFDTQRLLLSSLYTAWTPSHYAAIWICLRDAVERDALVDEWIQALLHLDEMRALEDLRNEFFTNRFFSKKPKSENQISIMKAILHHRPRHLEEFLPRLLKAMKAPARTKVQTLIDFMAKKGRA